MEPRRVLRLAVVAVTAVAFGLVSAPGAAARGLCEAPPGTSAVEQYCETLPGARGNRLGGSGLGRTVDRDTANELGRPDRDGLGVLALPPSAQARGAKADTGRERSAPKTPSDNPIGALGSAVDSGSSVGTAFLWLLLAIAVAMGALAWVRSRGNTAD